MAAIEQDVDLDDLILFDASIELKNNKKFVLACVEADGMQLESANSLFQNDKDVVLAAVKQYGGALKFASRLLQDNIDVVLEAISGSNTMYGVNPDLLDDSHLIHASPSAQNHPAVVEPILKNLREAIEAINSPDGCPCCSVKSDVNPSVLKDSFPLLSPELRANRFIVLEVVKFDGMQLEFCPTLQNDEEIVLKAVKQNSAALRFISNIDLEKHIVNEYDVSFQNASLVIRSNKDIVLKLLKKYSYSDYLTEYYYKHVADTLKNDYAFAVDAVKINKHMRKLLPRTFY